MCIADEVIGANDMTLTNNDFTDVVVSEYDTVFHFYVRQLEFQHMHGELAEINQSLSTLDAKEEPYRIIEGVKCDDAYALYIDGGIT